MAPVDAAPAMAVSLTLAVWLIDGSAAGGGLASPAALRRAAAAGWWWGFGYFLAGLWWLGAAFLVEADKFAWALPLGVLGLPAGLALFPALGFALSRLVWSTGGWRVLALAAGLGASEWLRGNIFTGFPWNALGMAFGGNLVLAQASAWIGLWGLTLAVVAICAAPATLADPVRRRLARSPVGYALIAFAALIAFGGLRLAGAGEEVVKGVKLRVMQPNLPQDAKFRPENKDAILTRYLDLSDRATSPQSTGVADATHLIWPESAFPFILSRDAGALARIGAALKGGTTLITGAARLDEQAAAYFNAIQVVSPGGAIVESYDKAHLVPFGEYLPFKGMWRALGITQFVHIPGGFTAGARRRPLTVPGLPAVAPLVCYEAIFSGEVTPEGRDEARRPGLMLNVTNDGWFGATSGPYQHLAQARLRAVEEGLPLVRAANTGVSAVIDPYGRIRASLPLGVADVLDAPLPAAISPPPFARWGHWAALLLGALCLAGALVGRLQR
ncbi:MAG: apolipoprotein N-acyltransferase [Rhizobiales bacterium]|nr:apolipoprotein N-acyltransferase [Hyphomicrobiales bacterium]